MNKYNEYLLAYEGLESKINQTIEEGKFDQELIEMLKKILKGLRKNFDSIYATDEVIHADLVSKIEKIIKELESFEPQVHIHTR